jgi:hypothetical protein
LQPEPFLLSEASVMSALRNLVRFGRLLSGRTTGRPVNTITARERARFRGSMFGESGAVLAVRLHGVGR